MTIDNFGPLDTFHIEFPFDDGRPKPVVLVGPNGSGKSIVLSHIIQPLMIAQSIVYSDTPEVELGKVFRVRGPSFINRTAEFYFSHVQFQNGLYYDELVTRKNKGRYSQPPVDITLSNTKSIWEQMHVTSNDSVITNIDESNTNDVTEALRNNCLLYFPHDRFEEPAWLNTNNFSSRAELVDPPKFRNRTIRQIVNYSPLTNNQNWIYGIAIDRFTRNVRTQNLNIIDNKSKQIKSVVEHLGFVGDAADLFDAFNDISRQIIRGADDPIINFGDRRSRTLSLFDGPNLYAPNVFYLSSGETALLNIFVSILRDYDCSESQFQSLAEITGLVIVDEIDLHLHTDHQYQILPHLIAMFPKVQFVITTHCPLFVLGMQTLFNDDGFALYRLPASDRISAEEFSEFGEAYKTLTQTQRYADDLRATITATQKTLLFVEGPTDKAYICKAAEHLGKEEMLANFKIEPGKGDGNLDNVWKYFKPVMSGLVSQDVILLYDPEANRRIQNSREGNLYRRLMSPQESHPIQKGIENLFAETILDRAIHVDKSFINVKPGGVEIKDGFELQFPPIWNVNTPRKSDLCDWICANGSKDDFDHFRQIFDILEEFVNSESIVAAVSGSDQPREP